MDDISARSLALHEQLRGKIEVTTRAKAQTNDDLALLYTPGVAEPCRQIAADYQRSFELTRRSNLVAVITDGTAVLGLGDIGPAAGMPVMEGKCLLFKEFGGVDAFPLCIDTHDVDEAIYLSDRIIVMTPRPGKISEIIKVPMHHPRQRNSGDFTWMREKLLKKFHLASEQRMPEYTI